MILWLWITGFSSAIFPATFLTTVCVIRAFTNKYYKLRDKGTYECISCGRDLFDSTTKYDSGSGWPAFYDVIDPKGVKLTKDASHGMYVSCKFILRIVLWLISICHLFWGGYITLRTLLEWIYTYLYGSILAQGFGFTQRVIFTTSSVQKKFLNVFSFILEILIIIYCKSS